MKKKNSPQTSKEYEDLFMQDNLHFHFDDIDLCSEDLSMKYILVRRIQSLFSFVERLNRYEWDNSTEADSYFQHKVEIQALEYILTNLKKEQKEDVDTQIRDWQRRKDKK